MAAGQYYLRINPYLVDYQHERCHQRARHGGHTVYQIEYSSQNGNFEAGPTAGRFVKVPASNTQITGWAVTGASIDYIGTYWVSADGSHSLELSGNTASGVKQALAR